MDRRQPGSKVVSFVQVELMPMSFLVSVRARGLPLSSKFRTWKQYLIPATISSPIQG